MPELPEVETVRRALLPLMGRRVIEAHLLRRDVLRVLDTRSAASGTSRRGLGRTGPVPAGALLQCCTIIDIRRRGKALAIVAHPDGHNNTPEAAPALGVHLGMTGALTLCPARTADDSPADARTSHLHALWRFDNASSLTFTDPRRFGGLWSAPTFAHLADTLWKDLGPDALTIEADVLHHALRRTQRAVKAALLDQSVLAGVGNIYADEALFDAGIRPARRASTVTRERAQALARAIRDVLARAVNAGGSTIRDYRTPDGEPGAFQNRHLVYGRAGQACFGCGSTLRRATIAQRTTVWCPQCQR